MFLDYLYSLLADVRLADRQLVNKHMADRQLRINDRQKIISTKRHLGTDNWLTNNPVNRHLIVDNWPTYLWPTDIWPTDIWLKDIGQYILYCIYLANRHVANRHFVNRHLVDKLTDL